MKNTKFIYAAILLLANATAQAAGIAFVTNVKGDAKAESVKLTLMSELNKGQRIACVADCVVGIMFLQSGKEFVVKGPGEYSIGDNEVTAKIGVPPTVRDTSWRISPQTVVQVAQTSSASVRMRSAGGVKPEDKTLPGERLLYPVQTRVVTLQPIFQWASTNARGPFEFELVTADGSRPVYKTKSGAPMTKLPNMVKLLPDTEYNWTVTAAGKAFGSSSFKTLSAPSLELIQKQKPDSKAAFNDQLLYALTLHQLEAKQDAQDIWSRLAKERPDLPELAALAK